MCRTLISCATLKTRGIHCNTHKQKRKREAKKQEKQRATEEKKHSAKETWHREGASPQPPFKILFTYPHKIAPFFQNHFVHRHPLSLS
jgi:hypothetical protein